MCEISKYQLPPETRRAFKKSSIQMREPQKAKPPKEATGNIYYNGERVQGQKLMTYRTYIDVKRYLWLNNKDSYSNISLFEFVEPDKLPTLAKV